MKNKKTISPETKTGFELREGFGHFDFDILNEMLQNQDSPIAVYIVRGFLEENACEEMKRAFSDTIQLMQGGNRTNDFVSVEQIGGTQFMKSTNEYMDECEMTRPHIDRLLSYISDEEIKNDFLLESTLTKLFRRENITFGPSTYQKRHCNLFTIRKWTNKENLALLPHEDLSQLNVARRDDYEIGGVKKVIACNLCVSNKNGGEFLIWNKCPSETLKKELGVENNGYPYSLELLADSELLSVNINAGDLYFINANLIHAVKEIKGKDRITLGRFMGYCSSDKVVYWT